MELIDDYITTKYNVFLSELKLKGKTSGVFGATISDEAQSSNGRINGK